MVGVVIIEDSETERVLTAAQVSRDSAMQVLGCFANYEAAALEMDRLAPDVILLDLTLPGTPGLRAIELIAKRWPQTKVLVFSNSCDQTTVLAVLAAGAKGYLQKMESGGRLPHAIWRVHTGFSILSPQVLDVVVQSFHGRLPLVLPLSPLQTEVLLKRNRGDSYKMIEAELGLSKSALKKCVREILRKTFADSTAQAVFHRSR